MCHRCWVREGSGDVRDCGSDGEWHNTHMRVVPLLSAEWGGKATASDGNDDMTTTLSQLSYRRRRRRHKTRQDGWGRGSVMTNNRGDKPREASPPTANHNFRSGMK